MGQADMQSVADVVALDQERQKRAEPGDSSLSTAGGMLRAAREAMSLDIPAVAQGTNIKAEHLEAIEAMDIAALPAQPYTMGFVRAYAREVALPEEALMERFRVQAGWAQQDRTVGVGTATMGKPPREGRELSVLLLFAVIGFALWCAWKLLISNAPVPQADAGRFTYTGSDLDDVPVVERPVVFEEVTVPAVPEESGAEPTDSSQAQTADAAVPDETPTEVESTPAIVSDPAPIAVTRPQLLTRIEPVYPPLCEGNAAPVETVVLSYSINGRGRVTGPSVQQSTNACFNGAAVAALSRWRYDAGTIQNGGVPNQTTQFVFERPY